MQQCNNSFVQRVIILGIQNFITYTKQPALLTCLKIEWAGFLLMSRRLAMMGDLMDWLVTIQIKSQNSMLFIESFFMI